MGRKVCLWGRCTMNRRKSMARRRLIIERSDTHAQRPSQCLTIDVSDDMPIGPLIATLAARFGYPLVDRFGSPIPYRLRPLAGEMPFPATGRLMDIPVRSGDRFVLETTLAFNETMPIQQAPQASASQVPIGLSRR